MGLFTVEELREVISVKVLAGQDSVSGKHVIRQISTDSRSVRRGDLFVALRGERYDGHEFVPAVLAVAAAFLLIEALRLRRGGEREPPEPPLEPPPGP